MVFCCIAIVGIAVSYWVFLSMRQLFAGPRRDLSVSKLPVPPRALTGNSPQPVWGHTFMFQKHGGDIALFFPPEWREWNCLPKNWSRPLGDCFSAFIWGQWRVVIRGRERVKLMLESSGLKEGWAWSPPVSLLGKSCLSLLPDDEADFLQSLLVEPLSHRHVLRLAPQFAEAAEHYVDDLIAGKFDSKKHESNNHDHNDNYQDEFDECGWSDDGMFVFDGIGQSFHSSRGNVERPWQHKIKFDGLRSYTLDLINGPVLGLRTGTQNEPAYGERKDDISQDNIVDQHSGDRDNLFLWMDRLKRALCVIKLSMGREWMYIWLFSEYGRAINGRMHLEEVISVHVATRAQETTVKHASGQLYHDPFVMPIPFFTMTENYRNRNQTVTGERHAGNNRPRSCSEPHSLSFVEESDGVDDCRDPSSATSARDFITSRIDENASRHDIHSRHDRECSGHLQQPKSVSFDKKVLRHRPRAQSSPEISLTQNQKAVSPKSRPERQSPDLDTPETLLDHMLQQADGEGNGLTKAVTTELCILLWMMMDAGNAWTAMVLNLLSLDQSACNRVQQELDMLISIHGKAALFTESVLNQMVTLDAVLYEAIRLCPPFLGGMKVTSETIELPDCGIQIPKNTNVVFSQPTDEPFDLSKALGKKPEELGYMHPCPELYGFLPFKGLEVPLMVLQSKIFVAVLLQRCSPFLSKKRTFIRRVKAVFSTKVRGDDVYNSHILDDNMMDVSSVMAEESSVSKWEPKGAGYSKSIPSLSTLQTETTTQTGAMKLFTKIPFPEPRRVINVRERNSALEILGVAQLGYQ